MGRRSHPMVFESDGVQSPCSRLPHPFVPPRLNTQQVAHARKAPPCPSATPPKTTGLRSVECFSRLVSPQVSRSKRSARPPGCASPSCTRSRRTTSPAAAATCMPAAISAPWRAPSPSTRNRWFRSTTPSTAAVPRPQPAAPMFEAERIRSDPRRPNWTAAMVAAIVAVVGFVGFTFFKGGDDGGTSTQVAEGSTPNTTSPKPKPTKTTDPKPVPSDSAIAAARGTRSRSSSAPVRARAGSPPRTTTGGSSSTGCCCRASPRPSRTRSGSTSSSVTPVRSSSSSTARRSRTSSSRARSNGSRTRRATPRSADGNVYTASARQSCRALASLSLPVRAEPCSAG